MRIGKTVEINRRGTLVSWFGVIREIDSSSFVAEAEGPSGWGKIKFDCVSLVSSCGKYTVTRFIQGPG